MQEKLATKEDLHLVKAELKEEIAKLREDLMKWSVILCGLTISSLSLIMSALKFLH